jgi:gamma-glutamyltranspeptidase/glutathione hydrolase
VVAINAMGYAPTGATVDFTNPTRIWTIPGLDLPSDNTGTPGGLLTMLAEYGTMSLAEVWLLPCNWQGLSIEEMTAKQY